MRVSLYNRHYSQHRRKTEETTIDFVAIHGIVSRCPAPLFQGAAVRFPLGLRLLNRAHSAEVPWAWGINGCFSVVGAAMATLIAVEVGYSLLLVLAAGAYLVSMMVRFQD